MVRRPKAVSNRDSDLDRLRLVIDTISLVDEPLMVNLETARAHGQNKYPIRQTWHALLAEGRKECENLSTGKVGSFGRIIRVSLETDRRIFTPIARHTEKWKRAYNRRSSVERVTPM